MFIFTALFYLIASLDSDLSLIRTADAMSNSGNTFSTPNDNIADCEHRGDNDRTIMADNSDYANNAVNCTYCERPALNGTPGQSAIVCETCGATICETCNEPNQDSD